MAQPARVINMDDHRSDGPQLEDGFLRIANELEDAILLKVRTFRHSQVVRAVIRKTYGYGKKEDDISLSQIAEMTGLQRSHVSVALRELEQMHVLNPIRPGRFGQVVGLNKRHDQWLADVTKTVTVTESVSECSQNGNSSVPVLVHSRSQNGNNKRQPQKTTPKDNSNSSPAALSAAAVAPATKPKRVSKPKQDDAADAALQTACRETWGAYCVAYAARYKVAPVRNATVNAHVKNFVKRLGAEESPQVAAWFVSHPGRFYVQSMHGFGVMLKDAEKLRTEWATGRIVTATAASQSDRTGTMGATVSRLLAECEGGSQ